MREYVRVFKSSDLVLSDYCEPVEHIGGPNDGEFLPANQNGLRDNGIYVVCVDALHAIIAKQYVPRSQTDT